MTGGTVLASYDVSGGQVPQVGPALVFGLALLGGVAVASDDGGGTDAEGPEGWTDISEGVPTPPGSEPSPTSAGGGVDLGRLETGGQRVHRGLPWSLAAYDASTPLDLSVDQGVVGPVAPPPLPPDARPPRPPAHPPDPVSRAPAWWTEFVRPNRGRDNPDGPRPDPTRAPSGDLDDLDDLPEPPITVRTLPEARRARPAPFAPHEIVVYGRRLEAARERVDERMIDLGYTPTRTRDGRTVWKNRNPGERWKPRVIIDDDGWYELRTPVVSGLGPRVKAGEVRRDDNTSFQAMDRTVPVVAPGVGGSFAGRRLRKQAEARVARQVDDVVRDLAEAQQEVGFAAVVANLPARLDRLWYDGLDREGRTVDSRRERVAALLEWWATRTRTREGETIRRMIGDYLRHEVGPVDTDLLAEAEAECGCALFGT